MKYYAILNSDSTMIKHKSVVLYDLFHYLGLKIESFKSEDDESKRVVYENKTYVGSPFFLGPSYGSSFSEEELIKDFMDNYFSDQIRRFGIKLAIIEEE